MKDLSKISNWRAGWMDGWTGIPATKLVAIYISVPWAQIVFSVLFSSQHYRRSLRNWYTVDWYQGQHQDRDLEHG